MDILIASIIILGIMLFFVFIMFKNVIKRINHNARRYFVNKLDDYNEIVVGKEFEIEKLNNEIKKLNKKKEELEQYKDLVPARFIRKRETANKAIYDIKAPKYREENFFFNYKELKKKFTFDKEKLIKEFIKQHQDKNNEKDYKTLSNFKKKFDKEAIYQLMTLPGEEQMEILAKILTDKEKKLIDLETISEDKSKFNIMLLFKKVDELMIKVDPIINIYVSKYDKEYDYIDPYIRTKHYSNMSEGVIIEYKGKSYDFSI